MFCRGLFVFMLFSLGVWAHEPEIPDHCRPVTVQMSGTAEKGQQWYDVGFFFYVRDLEYHGEKGGDISVFHDTEEVSSASFPDVCERGSYTLEIIQCDEIELDPDSPPTPRTFVAEMTSYTCESSPPGSN